MMGQRDWWAGSYDRPGVVEWYITIIHHIVGYSPVVNWRIADTITEQLQISLRGTEKIRPDNDSTPSSRVYEQTELLGCVIEQLWNLGILQRSWKPNAAHKTNDWRRRVFRHAKASLFVYDKTLKKSLLHRWSATSKLQEAPTVHDGCRQRLHEA